MLTLKGLNSTDGSLDRVLLFLGHDPESPHVLFHHDRHEIHPAVRPYPAD